MKRSLFWIALFLGLFCILELLCAGTLWYLKRTRDLSYGPRITALTATQGDIVDAMVHGRSSGHLLPDTELGWLPVPGLAAIGQNAQGIRSERAFTFFPPEGTLRIAAFGESFTFGEDVDVQEAWPTLLEEWHPGIEVLNFGVAGYGMDQAYLRWKRESPRFHPHVLLIGFFTEDLYRSVNTFLPFGHPGTHLTFGKPRFVLKDGELTLLPNPLPTMEDYEELLLHEEETLDRIAQNDFYLHTAPGPSIFDVFSSVRLIKTLLYRQPHSRPGGPITPDGLFDPSSESYQVTDAILLQWVEEAREQGEIPIVLFFPHRIDLLRHRKGGGTSYESLLRELTEKNIQTIDVLGAFEDSKEPPDVFYGTVHFTSLGNDYAARYLLQSLLELGILKE